jgi:hypothetical protein
MSKTSPPFHLPAPLGVKGQEIIARPKDGGVQEEGTLRTEGDGLVMLQCADGGVKALERDKYRFFVAAEE